MNDRNFMFDEAKTYSVTRKRIDLMKSKVKNDSSPSVMRLPYHNKNGCLTPNS